MVDEVTKISNKMRDGPTASEVSQGSPYQVTPPSTHLSKKEVKDDSDEVSDTSLCRSLKKNPP